MFSNPDPNAGIDLILDVNTPPVLAPGTLLFVAATLREAARY